MGYWRRIILGYLQLLLWDTGILGVFYGIQDIKHPLKTSLITGTFIWLGNQQLTDYFRTVGEAADSIDCTMVQCDT